MEGITPTSLYPPPPRVSGTVTALSSDRDTEVLPRRESHARLHPGDVLEGVLGCRQPCLVSREYLRPELKSGSSTPLGVPRRGAALPSMAAAADYSPLACPGVNKPPGGWMGVLAGADGARGSHPCQLPTLSCPQPLGRRVSPRKGAGSTFSSHFCSSGAKPAAGCSHGGQSSHISSPRSAASSAGAGTASHG